MADAEWTMVTALGTWVLIVGTLCIEFWKSRQTRMINSATAVMNLNDRFESSEMRHRRKRLSAFLREPEKVRQLEYDVPGFLENLGLLTHRGVLDTEMVWNTLSVAILNYYLALRRPVDHFASWRDTDPMALEEFEWLFTKILRIEAKRRHSTRDRAQPSEQQIQEFLASEANLDVVPENP